MPTSLIVKPPDTSAASAKIALSAAKSFLKQRIYLTTQRLTNLPSAETDKLRAQLVTVLKFQQPGAPNIAPSERRALNTLRQVDSIVITKADKGKATVVMNKSDYLQKVRQHLADGPYRQITSSSITSIMNKSEVEVGRYLRSVINHLGQVFWGYVDDTFVVIKRDNVNSFHDYLNSLNPHIKFSMEIESTSGTLPFLDCITHKSGGKLKTTIYQKPTDTGTVLNYSSAHPKSVYASIVSSMFSRVRALCTEEIDRRAAQIETANRLQEIGYPVSLIRRQLRRMLAPVSRPSKEWIGTAVIPYKAGTSEVIRRVLNSANIRVAFQKGKTLRSVLVRLKDPLPVERTRDCVYKINCNDCTKVYIGQTARELHTRIGEHKRRINKPPKNVIEYQMLVKDSAMAVHALDTGHTIDLGNVEVLRQGLRFTPQRLIAEAVEITKHHSVNRIEGVELASIWKAVLDKRS
ncbi:hypothetical protein CLF_102306 [Clonorchis sinensis]|uniref:C2H2-type domain-containing protein n=1 Tax=Clonorchis sinensis TaxID=79923 RepID=G7YN05_CLOSI|nr:hypothetical protein CLF_102306 [Clonorchis sinensis]